MNVPFACRAMDGTIVKVHRSPSRGGITTKILALADALGNRVDFRLMPGQAHDLCETATLIRRMSAGSAGRPGL